MYKEGNVLNWASVIEPETMSQAHKASKLPFLGGHLALMPDAHVGKGATVGSVIPTVGAVIPSAVGVDIGCLDGETEFLTPNGWKRLDSYEDGDQVLGYDPESDLAEFTFPLGYVEKEYDWLYHLKSARGLDQMVSPDHKMLFFKGVRNRGWAAHVELAADFVAHHESLTKGIQGGFKATFSLPSTLHRYKNYTDDEIRFRVMVAADGSLRKNKRVVDRIEVHLRKERKIIRCANLLNSIGYKYTRYQHKDGTVTFSFEAPEEGKDLSFLYKCNSDQLKVASEESLLWDGSTFTHKGTTRSYFSSCDKSSADAIQFAFTASGIRAGVYTPKKSPKENWSRNYQVIPTKNEYVGIKPGQVDRVEAPNGKAYCFTMPTGFFIARRNGNIFATGNCGVASIETTFTSRDLPDSLDALHARLGQVIPAGVGQGHSEANAAAAALIKQSRDLGINLGQKLEATAANQLGSLGSGNHFVEVCLDERDVVWLVLHSGSRGVGNKLGNIHIESAKGLMKQYFITLDDPDLAYLAEGTPEFDAYIKAMLWAQDYAKMNRKVMLDALVAEFSVFIGRFTRAERIINCHHNFCEKEHHNGKDMWVTRKGAVRARKDDWVIIPGSMGTRSYIGKGLANPSSYNSCSHGAGRVLSRSEARRSLDKETLIKSMEGKSWNASQADSLIDEDPRSYKDIDQVMEDQKDLVEIHHTLHQILNYKGV